MRRISVDTYEWDDQSSYTLDISAKPHPTKIDTNAYTFNTDYAVEERNNRFGKYAVICQADFGHINALVVAHIASYF